MATKATEDEYQQVKDDLKALREDMAALTRSVAESQKANLTGLRDQLEKESREALDYARKTGDKALHDVEERITERPLLSILLMFLAGLLVGKLLDR